jgi:hypothetical protein
MPSQGTACRRVRARRTGNVLSASRVEKRGLSWRGTSSLSLLARGGSQGFQSGIPGCTLLDAGWKSIFAGDQHIIGEWG